jgi:hypothetical protein
MHDIFIELTVAFLKKVAKESDKHTTEKSKVKVQRNEVVLITPDYLQYAVYGRGPGKNPPLDNMLAFVNKNGIIFDGMDARGTAFAIQASIAKNGTKNWVPGAGNALDEFIDKNIEEYRKELNDEIVRYESKEIDGMLRKAFPPEIVFKI